MPTLIPLFDAALAVPTPISSAVLVEGVGKECLAGAQIVALFRLDGKIVALDGVCPHAGGPLAEGRISGTTVTCPWHGWQFNIQSGENCLNARIRARTFHVVEQSDGTLAIEQEPT